MNYNRTRVWMHSWRNLTLNPKPILPKAPRKMLLGKSSAGNMGYELIATCAHVFVYA